MELFSHYDFLQVASLALLCKLVGATAPESWVQKCVTEQKSKVGGAKIKSRNNLKNVQAPMVHHNKASNLHVSLDYDKSDSQKNSQ